MEKVSRFEKLLLLGLIILTSLSYGQGSNHRLDSIEAVRIIESEFISIQDIHKKIGIKIDTISNINKALDELKSRYQFNSEEERNSLPANRRDYILKRAALDSTYLSNFESTMLIPQKKWDIDLERLGFKSPKPTSKSYFHISYPVFNKERNMALITKGQICPGLCGSTSTMLLKKENGFWIKLLSYSAIF